MRGTPSRPQTAPSPRASSQAKTTPLTTLEVRRLKRLKEIEHMLKRKDMLRASPSGLYQPWSASGELPRGRRNLLPQQPAPIPPLNPRVVQQELVKARRRASRLGEWETLNRLRTPSGIAAFERRVRADSYGRVQRRVNGIHELPRSGSLHEHLGENLQSIETQTQSEDLQLQQLQEQNEQALEDMAQADLAYLDMVLHKAGMHPTAGGQPTTATEQALAQSWQQLILLRLESQKLHLRLQVNTMSPQVIEKKKAELMKETRAIARKLQKQLQQLVPQAAEGEGGGSGTPTSSAEGTSENLHLAALMQRMQGSLVGDEGGDGGGGAGPSSAGADGEGAQVRLRDADWTAAEGGGTRNGGWGTGAPAATAAKAGGNHRAGTRVGAAGGRHAGSSRPTATAAAAAAARRTAAPPRKVDSAGRPRSAPPSARRPAGPGKAVVATRAPPARAPPAPRARGATRAPGKPPVPAAEQQRALESVQRKAEAAAARVMELCGGEGGSPVFKHSQLSVAKPTGVGDDSDDEAGGWIPPAGK